MNLNSSLRGALAAVLIGTLNAAMSPAVAAPKPQTYLAAGGYYITPPSGFLPSPNVIATDAVFMKAGGENINVVVRACPGTATPAQMRATSRKVMSALATNYRFSGQGTLRVGGQSASWVSGRFRMGTPSRALRNCQVMAVHNGSAYVFTYTAPAATYVRYEPAFKRMLATLRWPN